MSEAKNVEDIVEEYEVLEENGQMEENIEEEVVRIDLSKYGSQKPLKINENDQTQMNELISAIKEKRFTDITLLHSGVTIHCHRDVLRYHCELFQGNLPKGGQILLKFKPFDPKIIPMVYEWMINESIECPRYVLVDLMDAAHYLRMPYFVKDILRCVDDRSIFNINDVIQFYFQTQKVQALSTSETMMATLGKHFLLIVHFADFRELNTQSLCELLALSLLHVQSEIEVLYSVFIWLYTDYEWRIKHMARVLKYVRFQLMPTAFLFTLGAFLIELDHELADVLYPILQLAMWHQQEVCQCGIDDVDGTFERSWIIDPMCPYGKDVKAGKYIDYIAFIKYVKSLNSLESFTSRIYKKPRQISQAKSNKCIELKSCNK